MGSAASHYQDWDAKPCEAINDVDGGTPCDVPRDELEKAKARYDALKREHRKDQAALATAGDALLEELGLAVAFHDAGSWTRVVARKNVPDPVSETHEPHEHMHEPHSPGTWLLRERLRKKHPEGEVGLGGVDGAEEGVDVGGEGARRQRVGGDRGAAATSRLCSCSF